MKVWTRRCDRHHPNPEVTDRFLHVLSLSLFVFFLAWNTLQVISDIREATGGLPFPATNRSVDRGDETRSFKVLFLVFIPQAPVLPLGLSVFGHQSPVFLWFGYLV